MFFILSKLLMFLVKPLTWIVLAFLGTFILRKKAHKQNAFYTGFALLLIFTNPLLNNAVMNWWEPDPVLFEAVPAQYDAVIVLGGYADALQKPRDRVHFSEGYDRLSNALALYKEGKAGKVLLTGGSSQVVGEKIKSSLIIEDYLLRLGIPEKDLLIEPESRNTYENAKYTTRLLNQKMPDGRFLMVTSGYHMFRARHCFEAQGLEIDPFPADFRGEAFRWGFDTTIVPSSEALESWERLIKEWIGIVAYWGMGYI